MPASPVPIPGPMSSIRSPQQQPKCPRPSLREAAVLSESRRHWRRLAMKRFPQPVAILLIVVLIGMTPATTYAQAATPVPVSTPVAIAEFVWESTGDADESLSEPWFLSLDPEGNIWVVDGNHSQFQIVAPDGTFLDVWGTAGADPGEFDFVEHGASDFDAEGNLYVVDSGNHRVQKFGPDRGFLTTWGSEGSGEGQFLRPIDITVAPDGRVYVIDDRRNDVQVFDSDGHYLFTFGGLGRGAGKLLDTGGLTIAADGSIWIADYGNFRVAHFSADGDFLSTWGEGGWRQGEFLGPVDIALDAHGRVYVVDNGKARVQIYDEAGHFLADVGDDLRQGELTDPVSLALGDAG